MAPKPTYDELEKRVQKLEKEVAKSERLKNQLWENEQTVRSTLESINDLIFVLDKNGTFINYFQNPENPSLFAHPDKFLGKSYKKILPRHVTKLIDSAVSRVLASCETTTINYDLDIQGEKKWFNTTLNPRVDSDEKYDGLTVITRDITERKQAEASRQKLIQELQNALAEVKTLSGLLPICASCKNIRDDKGYWNQIESYIRNHSEAEFSHSICPECVTKLYPELSDDK